MDDVVIAGRSVSAGTVVAAQPAQVFAPLANPHRHHEFDGSGTVRQAVSGPRQLGLGDRFGVARKTVVPYRITNRVVEFEPDRRIAWCHFMRAVWRYELEPVAGGTLVRESWDVSTDHQRAFLKLGPVPERTRRNMEATLRRIEDLVTE